MATSLDEAIRDLQEVENNLSPVERRYVSFICLLDDRERGLVGMFNFLKNKHGQEKALALLCYSLECISSDHSERLKRHCSNPAENWLPNDPKVQKVPLRACLAKINSELSEEEFESLRDTLVAREQLGNRCEYKNKDLRLYKDLESAMVITVTNVGKLVENLKSLKLNAAAKELEDYISQRTEGSSSIQQTPIRSWSLPSRGTPHGPSLSSSAKSQTMPAPSSSPSSGHSFQHGHGMTSGHTMVPHYYMEPAQPPVGEFYSSSSSSYSAGNTQVTREGQSSHLSSAVQRPVSSAGTSQHVYRRSASEQGRPGQPQLHGCYQSGRLLPSHPLHPAGGTQRHTSDERTRCFSDSAVRSGPSHLVQPSPAQPIASTYHTESSLSSAPTTHPRSLSSSGSYPDGVLSDFEPQQMPLAHNMEASSPANEPHPEVLMQQQLHLHHQQWLQQQQQQQHLQQQQQQHPQYFPHHHQDQQYNPHHHQLQQQQQPDKSSSLSYRYDVTAHSVQDYQSQQQSGVLPNLGVPLVHHPLAFQQQPQCAAVPQMVKEDPEDRPKLVHPGGSVNQPYSSHLPQK